MSVEPSSPLRRPRVSLLSLLLLTTVVGLGITVSQLWTRSQSIAKQLAEQGARHEALRREHGDLIVSDPTKLQACQRTAWDDPPWLWRFRLHVPDDRPYQLALLQGDGIPASGTAVPGLTKIKLPLVAGETTASLYFFHTGQQWKYELATPKVVTSRFVEGTVWMPWRASPENNTTLVCQVDGVEHHGGRAVAADNAEPLLLRRLRARREPAPTAAQPLKNPTKPAPGFILWVEPVP